MRFHAVFASFALFSACASAGSSLQLDVTETSSSEYCNVWDGYSCSDSDTGFRIAYGYDFKAFGAFMWVTQTGLIVILGLLSLFLIQRQPKQTSAAQNDQ